MYVQIHGRLFLDERAMAWANRWPSSHAGRRVEGRLQRYADSSEVYCTWLLMALVVSLHLAPRRMAAPRWQRTADRPTMNSWSKYIRPPLKICTGPLSVSRFLFPTQLSPLCV